MSHLKIRGKIFGQNINIKDASLVILPVPWEATLAKPSGTSNTPEYILKYSYNINLFDKESSKYSKSKIAMLPIPNEWAMLSNQLQGIVTGYINSLESLTNKRVYPVNSRTIEKINKYCFELKEYIKKESKIHLDQNKKLGIIGGDHSTCLGLIEALTAKHKEFGILQIDSYPNLYENYQNFKYSHFSIMHNILKNEEVTRLVQVGIRDISEIELKYIENSNDRILPFFNNLLEHEKFNGTSWDEICEKIIDNLPSKVYLSIDINGFDHNLCPGTSYSTPGGLDFDEALYLIEMLNKKGKKIIGFDLCEVASDDSRGWDIEVATRLVYKLCLEMEKSSR